jgi:ATP-dependent RNA helicase SUPV3L1/SUV3
MVRRAPTTASAARLGPTVTALLGPTNTGKTHRAVERMLEHETGAIGVPLRLLARELYDKLTARFGESRIALVTGEEKRIPARASYWICTVEAMPTELVDPRSPRAVAFVAIDEIQLAAHDQRGHVFTERLLHARGRIETMLLGADTIRPIVERLVPGVTVTRLPRLSRLSSVGSTPLSAIPRRSAIVAFSIEKVFEIAERVRARKGGAAVVLGVLSPRTRNAQVAMYQAGEVDHLVATDAIGMGLNLDVEHVAFAGLRKFDGRETRDLDPSEIGQIAGRAGRYTRDGTFGGLAPLAIAESVVRAVEGHRFAPIARIRWRSSDLDFASIDALRATLGARPFDEVLRLDDEAEDQAALGALAALPEIRARATDPSRVALLWDVCRIPDYRKLLFESHVALLAAIYARLVDAGTLDETWVSSRVEELDDPEGLIETLTARLSSIRTWAYVGNQRGWLRDPRALEGRTREVEDRLSDALHDRLVQRFVERRPKRLASGVAVVPKPIDPTHPFAKLQALRAVLPRGEVAGREQIEELIDAPHDAFDLDPDGGAITFRGTVVAHLVPGASLLAPDVRLSSVSSDVAAGARSRILRRLVAFARDAVEDLVGPIRAVASSVSADGRGLLYQLERSLGTIASDGARAQISGLTDDDRGALARIGIRVGERATFAKPLLRATAMARRALLVSLAYEPARRPKPPRPSAVSFAIGPRIEPGACAAMGFLVVGRRAIRADVLEAVAAELANDPLPAVDRVASRVGCPKREVPALLAILTQRPSSPSGAGGISAEDQGPLHHRAPGSTPPRP